VNLAAVRFAFANDNSSYSAIVKNEAEGMNQQLYDLFQSNMTASNSYKEVFGKDKSSFR
jgi:hypothetical protein